MSENSISSSFAAHYADCIQKYGPTAAGVDWRVAEKADASYDKMLEVIRRDDLSREFSLLDVGCGYGGILSFAKEKGLKIKYTGIDIVGEMISHGKNLHPDGNFIQGDYLFSHFEQKYDYVICNGILTLKLEASILDMDKYADQIIRKMFGNCVVGIAFNVRTNKVNFISESSYYRSPVETLAFCLNELSDLVRLDHSYPRYEFTTYVYRR